MIKCDSGGDLMIFIAKMMSAGKGRFVAFGRVFSGEAEIGKKVIIKVCQMNDSSKIQEFKVSLKNIMVLAGKKMTCVG
jgi:elongation factor 2